MPSPTRFLRHGVPHADIITILGTYRAWTPGVLAGDNSTARLDLDNEPQPDGMLLIDPEYGGQAIFSDGFVEGAPELALEVAASSVSIDLNAKFHVYRRNGVKEYLVWRVLDKKFDWFRFHAGVFVPMPPDADGILKSSIFPGLWLDAEALVRGDPKTALNVLHQGIAGPEHEAFVAGLAKALRGKS